MVINETKQTAVGAVVFLALVLMIAFSYGSGHKDMGKDGSVYNITATFNRIDGLMLEAPVMLSGVAIGKVTDATLDDHYRAVVTMSIDKTYKIPADTSLAIHTDGLFGSKYVNLDPGGEETYLKDGDSLDYAQDAMILSELLDLIISQGTQNLEKRKELEKTLRDAAAGDKETPEMGMPMDGHMEMQTDEKSPSPFGGGLLK